MKEIVIGVVGPERKLKARPMQMLINYLYKENSCFRMTFIDEHVYLTVDVHQWPIVDVLLILYAPPFPVAKVLDYVTKRQVKMVNNLYMQRYMMDRRYVRRVLQRAGVPVPNAVEVDRGNGDWVEWKTDAPDEICVCGKDGTRLVMRKPFVEKPVDTEDHSKFILVFNSLSVSQICANSSFLNKQTKKMSISIMPVVVYASYFAKQKHILHNIYLIYLLYVHMAIMFMNNFIHHNNEEMLKSMQSVIIIFMQKLEKHHILMV